MIYYFGQKTPKVGGDTGKKERIALGILGAFLFSLAGGLVWVLLNIAGFLAGLSGFIGVVSAVYGYKIFAGKLTKKGVIISIVFAFIVLVAAWYGCFINDIHEACKGWYADGVISFMPSWFECIKYGPDFLSDPNVAPEYFKQLAIGMGLALFGSIFFIVRVFGSLKRAKETEQTEQSADQNVIDNVEWTEIESEDDSDNSDRTDGEKQ